MFSTFLYLQLHTKGLDLIIELMPYYVQVIRCSLPKSRILSINYVWKPKWIDLETKKTTSFLRRTGSHLAR